MQYSHSLSGLRAGARRRFQPGWLPSLVVLALLPVLLGLGCWQLSRAEQKRELLASYEARRSAAPLDLARLDALPDRAFRRVRLHGQFDARHSLLLDSRIRAGQAGVELLQPFRDSASGRWVLLNRGWLAWPDRRETVHFSTPDGAQTLVAWLYQPPGASFELKDIQGHDWPRLVNHVDAAGLWRELGIDGLADELRLEPGPASYTVDWPIVAMGPERHQGYAVQWFALAAALLALFVYLGIHNARETCHAPSLRPE